MEPRDHHQQTYVLTCDLPQKVRLFEDIGLVTPPTDDQFFIELKRGLSERLQSVLGTTKVRIIEMDDLAGQILKSANKKQRSVQSSEIVSTCFEIAMRRRGHTLEINRIVDVEGKIIGMGARPGCKPVEAQFDTLKQACHDKPIVVVEDGSFTGSTMRFIIEACKKRNIPVACIVLGFAFPNAISHIQEVYTGEIITIEDGSSFVDWMPDHDFFPYIPNCGRILGFGANGRAFPYYNAQGIPYAVPYIRPFSPMSEWTSIPKEACDAISTFCKKKVRELFGMLEDLNKRHLTVADLKDLTPRVTIPVCIGNQYFPNLRMDERIALALV